MKNYEFIQYALDNKEDILKFDYDSLDKSLGDGILILDDNKKFIKNINEGSFKLLDPLNNIPKEKNISYGIIGEMPLEQKVWTQCRNILAKGLYNNNTELYYLLHVINDFALYKYNLKKIV